MPAKAKIEAEKPCQFYVSTISVYLYELQLQIVGEYFAS